MESRRSCYRGCSTCSSRGSAPWNAPKEVLGSVSHWSSAWLSSTEAESAPPAKDPAAAAYLPGLNGYEVARRFREEPDSSAVVLVALTGYGTPEAQERSRKSGFNYHLIKPANGEALEEIMREAASARKRTADGAPDAATTVISPQSTVAANA